jgi:hypothetical protein
MSGAVNPRMENDPADLRALAAVLDQASERVARLAAAFEASAAGPRSAAVIGSADSAAGYAQGLDGCLRGLAQLGASLADTGERVGVAAVYYEQNEAASTAALGGAGQGAG